MFVSIPLVVRAVAPVLRITGPDEADLEARRVADLAAPARDGFRIRREVGQVCRDRREIGAEALGQTQQRTMEIDGRQELLRATERIPGRQFMDQHQ